jgi:hypothetical protein
MQSVQQVLKSQDPKQNEAGQRKAAIGWFVATALQSIAFSGMMFVYM